MGSHRLIPDVRRSEAVTDGTSLHGASLERDIRPTRAEIDLDALVGNAAWLKRRIGGVGLLGVVKADGYGHGAVVVARALRERAPIAGLCVSLAEEGLELRAAEIGGPILVMGGCYGTAHHDVAAMGLTPIVFALADVEAFARSGTPIGVHLTVDTGMSRLGVRPDRIGAFLEGCSRFPSVRIKGLMTHLACADSDPEMTRLQLARLAAVEPEVRAAARGR